MSKKLQGIVYTSIPLAILLVISLFWSHDNYKASIREWGPTEPSERAAELGELPGTMPSMRTIRAYLNYHMPKAAGTYTDYKRILPESLTNRLDKWECEKLAEYVLSQHPRILVFDPWLRGCLNTHALRITVADEYLLSQPGILDLFDRGLWTPEVVIACGRRPMCRSNMPVGLFSNTGLLRAAIKEGILWQTDGDLEPWTPELVEEAIRKNAGNYEYIPERFRTFEVSLRAVREDGLLLRLVPREQRLMRNGLLCKEALRNDDRAESYVPAIFKYRFGP